MNSSLSPKPKQSIIDDKVVYVNKIISISPYLSKFYQDYIEDRDRYAKQFDKAVEYGSSDFYDVFQTHTKEDIFYLNEKIVLMANMKHNPYLLLHVCVSEFSFKNLIVKNSNSFNSSL